MNLRALVWGLVWLTAGAVAGAGWLPGSAGWATGPRIGVTVFLVMLGFTVALGGNAEAFLRRTTRPEDYKGGCPVGARCACGTFNMNTRKSCKGCGTPVHLAGAVASHHKP